MSSETNNTFAPSIEVTKESFGVRSFEKGANLAERTFYELEQGVSDGTTLDQLLPAQLSHVALYDPEQKKMTALRRKVEGNQYLPVFETWQGGEAPALKKGLFLVKLADVEATAEMVSHDTRSQLSDLAKDIGAAGKVSDIGTIFEKIKGFASKIIDLLKNFFPMMLAGGSQKSAKATAETELAFVEKYLRQFPPSSGARHARETTVSTEQAALETKTVTQVDEQLREKGLETLFTAGTPPLLKEATVMKLPVPNKELLAKVRSHLHDQVFTENGKARPVEVVMRLMRDNVEHQKAYATWLRWRYKEINTKEAYQKTTFGKLLPPKQDVADLQGRIGKLASGVQVTTLQNPKYARYAATAINKYSEPATKKPVGFVAHITDTPTFASTIEAFRSNNNFTQYVIDRDGTIVQLMPDHSVVAAASSSDSVPSLFNGGGYIHVECIAQGSPANLTAAQQKSLSVLAKAKMETHGFGIEQVIGHGVIYPETPGNGRHDNDFGYKDIQKLHETIQGLPT